MSNLKIAKSTPDLQIAKSPSSTHKLLVEAARLGQKVRVIELVKQGADVNGSYRNYRPLHALIQEDPHTEGSAPPSSRLACLTWLLKHGADPELTGAWPSARAIIVAASVGEPKYVEALRTAGAVVDGFVSAALGDTAAVARALKRDKAFAQARDPGGWTALQCAAASRLGRQDEALGRRLVTIARMLLAAGADARATLRSWGHDVDPVSLAVGSGQRTLLELLLAEGADVSSALVGALWRKDYDVAELALAQGVHINEARDAGRPLLNEMIRWGQVAQALWLLERGASPNIPNAEGWTAMHQAASRGNEQLARAVLEAGGDPSKPDASGVTPRDIAERAKKQKIVALFSKGTEVPSGDGGL